jgi:hypothetical protein
MQPPNPIMPLATYIQHSPRLSEAIGAGRTRIAGAGECQRLACTIDLAEWFLFNVPGASIDMLDYDEPWPHKTRKFPSRGPSPVKRYEVMYWLNS